jgi:pimeloyl-ACP methyl ester carboxylesterase
MGREFTTKSKNMTELTLSYRVVGAGRPLLLIHGFGISFNIWRNLAPRLSPHFMVVLIELPGVGGSPLPAEGQDYLSAALDRIEGVRRALGLEKWDVLGYSSGSRIAEAYVQAHAAHVCRVIFLAPLLVNPYKVRGLRLAFRVEQSMPAPGNWILSGWRLRFLISLLGFNLRPDPLGDEWYAEISSAPMRVLKETIWAMIPVAARPFSVPVPFVTIWGDRDIVTMKPRKQAASAYFVHGQHAAPVQSAEEVARTILSMKWIDDTDILTTDKHR